MSSDDSKGVSKRMELKKLLFQKKQELQRCKTKSDKEKIEAKYNELEAALMGKPAPEIIISESVEVSISLYSEVPKEKTKSQQKKERKEERQREHREQIIQEVGDGKYETELAKTELESIINKIPDGYNIVQVDPNGDCMYESFRLSFGGSECMNLRNSVAAYLEDHREDFEAFITDDFDAYLEGIRGSTWGSDLELEILSRIFGRKISVITRDREICFGAEFSGEPVFLSFHERQFSSNHYNAVLR
jgi:hypothetical protein